MSDLEEFSDRHPGWDLALRLGFGERGQAVVDFLDATKERKARRLRSLLDSAVQASGQSAEGIFEAVTENERLGDLFEDAAEAATHTAWEAKIRILGRAIAMAIESNDDATVDRAELIERAVADLEPIHARALWVFGHFPKVNPGGMGGGIPDMLRKFLPGIGAAADQVGSVLRRHGLITEEFWSNGLISLSAFGRELLEMLLEEGGIDSSRIGLASDGSQALEGSLIHESGSPHPTQEASGPGPTKPS